MIKIILLLGDTKNVFLVFPLVHLNGSSITNFVVYFSLKVGLVLEISRMWLTVPRIILHQVNISSYIRVKLLATFDCYLSTGCVCYEGEDLFLGPLMLEFQKENDILNVVNSVVLAVGTIR